MKKWIFLVLFVLIFNVLNVFAGSVKEIVLSDDTVVYGEIVGVSNGNYEIKTDNMGLVEIDEEKVVSIKNKPEGKGMTGQDVSDLKFQKSSPVEPNAVKAGIDALKRNFQADAATMQNISDLQNDPDFMAAIQDPEIMSAVNSGDINALTSNPKFLKLLNHPVVRGASERVK